MPKWLEKAVFYEIYPQSFCDTNADGWVLMHCGSTLASCRHLGMRGMMWRITARWRPATEPTKT